MDYEIDHFHQAVTRRIKCYFSFGCSSWEDFNWYRASRRR